MSAPLSIVGELTIYRAAELKDALLAEAALPGGRLDLGGVTDIDTAGLQLLLLARREAAACGHVLPLQPVSAAVREGCEQLGLADLLLGH